MEVQDLCVLLVESSHVQQRILSGQLQSIGVSRLRAVDTSAEAVQALSSDNPDVVLSSMHLADLSGAALLTRIRHGSEHPEVPFILVSSESSDYYLEPIKQSGVTSIIRKPCSEEDLRMALQRTVELITPSEVEGDLRALREMRVLVVDDSRTARRFITKVLSKLGLQHFVEAEDGFEGREKFDRASFDLVVTDYNMPRLDGQGLLRYIRNESTRPHTPVLMVTSESNESRLSAVSQLGVNALCDKPFEPTTVRRLIAGMVHAKDNN